MSLFTRLLSLALAACIARGVYLCYFHPLARYPGPWLARVTNAWRFITFFGGQHHLIEQRLHARYGRVVRVAPNWLSFSNLADFEAIYGFNKAIEKSDFYDFGRNRGSRAESIFSTKTEAGHRARKKKIVGPALTGTKVSAYEPVIDKHVDILRSRLRPTDRLPESNGNGPPLVNMAPLVHRYTLDAMLELIFGPTLATSPYTDSPAGDGICITLRIMTQMAWGFSLWPAFGWLMNTRLVDAVVRRPARNQQGVATGMAGLMGAVMPLLQTNSQQITQNPQPGIVKSWLDVPVSDANRMELSEVTADAVNMVIAGPGSTAAALTAILYHLGSPHGQRWQEKIRNETHGASTSSPALQAVIKETLRFNAAFPTAFPRVIRHGAETAIPGLPAPLPAGTMVSANTFVLGRSVDIWGDKVGEWEPQRWFGDEQQRREIEAKFVAFSKGSRSCVGRELALLVLTKAVTGILQRWKIRSQGALRGKSFLEMQYDESWMELNPIGL